MAGNDDTSTLLVEFGRIIEKIDHITTDADDRALMKVHRFIAQNAAALAERDATIERLTKENVGAKALAEAGIDVGKPMRETCLHFLNQAKSAEARATTAERELAEARAEVERKDAALRLIESWEPATQEITVANMMAAEARAALTAKGGENAEG